MSNPRSTSPQVTLKDIAQAVGLSYAAVSMALRNSPEIGTATRKRVQAVAREMNYHPNPLAVGMAHWKRDSKVRPVHSALAWLNFWPDPTELRSYKEFDLIWEGAVACAEKFGYRLDEFVVNRETPLKKLEKILHARNVPGIFIPPGPLADNWQDFHWEDFAVVRLSRPMQDLMAPSVSVDQSANAMLAFDIIRKKGCERVGFVGIRRRARLYGAGFLWAQTELPEKLRLPLLLFPENGSAGNEAALVAWLKKTKPDCILTECPEVLAILQKAGCRVPEDIGLASLNVLDGPIDAGIYQNPEEVGRVGALMAISLINDNAHGIPAIHREILIKGKWVDGASLPQRCKRHAEHLLT